MVHTCFPHPLQRWYTQAAAVLLLPHLHEERQHRGELLDSLHGVIPASGTVRVSIKLTALCHSSKAWRVCIASLHAQNNDSTLQR